MVEDPETVAQAADAYKQELAAEPLPGGEYSKPRMFGKVGMRMTRRKRRNVEKGEPDEFFFPLDARDSKHFLARHLVDIRTQEEFDSLGHGVRELASQYGVIDLETLDDFLDSIQRPPPSMRDRREKLELLRSKLKQAQLQAWKEKAEDAWEQPEDDRKPAIQKPEKMQKDPVSEAEKLKVYRADKSKEEKEWDSDPRIQKRKEADKAEDKSPQGLTSDPVKPKYTPAFMEKESEEEEEERRKMFNSDIQMDRFLQKVPVEVLPTNKALPSTVLDKWRDSVDEFGNFASEMKREMSSAEIALGT